MKHFVFDPAFGTATDTPPKIVDLFKIDRSFVTDLTSDRGDQVIVEAVLGMARRLGIEVVAEGVENAATARFLRGRGCNIGQGFRFGKGVPACRVMPLLAALPLSIGVAPGDYHAVFAGADLGAM